MQNVEQLIFKQNQILESMERILKNMSDDLILIRENVAMSGEIEEMLSKGIEVKMPKIEGLLLKFIEKVDGIKIEEEK